MFEQHYDFPSVCTLVWMSVERTSKTGFYGVNDRVTNTLGFGSRHKFYPINSNEKCYSVFADWIYLNKYFRFSYFPSRNGIK